MKFTVELIRFRKLLEQVSKAQPFESERDSSVRLMAVAPQVFLESNMTFVGIEALVLCDGHCSLSRERFLAVLKTFKGRKNITIEANNDGLNIDRFKMPLESYSSKVKAPAHLQGIPPTNLATLLPGQSSKLERH